MPTGVNFLIAFLIALTGAWHPPVVGYHPPPKGCHMPARVAPARCRIMHPMIVGR